MEKDMMAALADINRAIIKFRGVYSLWSKKHGISYNEMLVLYTIRDDGFCTQKKICDSYLLPRQTINHVITDMRKRGLLELSQTDCKGREKAFILSDKGKDYAEPFLNSLNDMEKQAVDLVGTENIRNMADAVLKYSRALQKAVEDNV